MTTFLLKDRALPVPRLEIRWRPPDEYRNHVYDYSLVIKISRWDVREWQSNVEDMEMRIRFGLGRVSGGGKNYPYYPNEDAIETPFRDGKHIQWDASQLGLPAFVVWGERAMELEPEAPREYPEDDKKVEETRTGDWTLRSFYKIRDEASRLFRSVASDVDTEQERATPIVQQFLSERIDSLNEMAKRVDDFTLEDFPDWWMDAYANVGETTTVCPECGKRVTGDVDSDCEHLMDEGCKAIMEE